MKLTTKVNLIIIVTVTLIIGGMFFVLGQHFDQQIQNHMLTTSRAVYNNILIFRQWIAERDGIFLKKTPNELPNPFLSHPEILTTSGDTLVLRNPAMVTRELSKLSYSMGKDFSFHLTSLKYINPVNKPDEFERKALKYYQARGQQDSLMEFYRLERIKDKAYFRYFGPLYTERSCVSCHGVQGFKEGDLRGGISILLSAEQHEKARNTHLMFFTITGLISILALAVPMAWSIRRSVIRPLKELDNAAVRMENGQFDFKVTQTGKDEIGHLSRSFENMRERIKMFTDALRASEQKYRTLTEHSLEAVTILDEQGNITDCNEKLCHLAGLSRKEMIGSKLNRYIRPDTQMPLTAAANPASGSEHYEAVMETGDGLKIPVEIYKTHTPSPSAPKGETMVYIRDLTERKKIEEHSIQAEKVYALGQVSAGIAHEIRNPLFALNNNLDYLQRRYQEDEVFTELYPELRQSVERIQHLVSAILDYARPHELQFFPVDVGTVLDQALLLVNKQFEKARIEISKDYQHHEKQTPADPHKLEQVFVNLFLNAFQAMDGSGKLTIVTEAKAGRLIIRIQDTGCGIPPEDLSRIFDPFYTKTPNGTGLGMSIVQRILEQHQAQYRLESKLGYGTTFQIELRLEEHDQI